jgi:Leucine-rich repeat (LRR) protein
MIRDMSGLENLRNLRVLNLDFNQIKIVEGTENL